MDPGTVQTFGDIDVFGIALDATDLLFSHAFPPGIGGAASISIARVPISGGTPTDVVGGVTSGSFAVAGDNLLFAGAGQLSIVPKAGGAPAAFAVDAGPIGMIASDGASVCWVSAETTLRCAPIPTAAVVTVLAGPHIAALQVISGEVFAMESDAADAGGATTLVRVPIGGGALTTIAASDSPEFFVDGGFVVFWKQGELTRVAVTGGPSVSLGASGTGPELVADVNCVYWPAEKSVKTIPLGGGAAAVDFAVPQYFYSAPSVQIAQDADAIFVMEAACAYTGCPAFMERFAKR